MARYTTKYPIGKKVMVYDVEGIITAITIRGRSKRYEVGYSNDGVPSNVTADECELEEANDRKMGF